MPATLDIQWPKCFQLRDPLTRGSAPGSHWGLCPQTPVIGSCSALAMVQLTPSAVYALAGVRSHSLLQLMAGTLFINPVGMKGCFDLCTACKVNAAYAKTATQLPRVGLGVEGTISHLARRLIIRNKCKKLTSLKLGVRTTWWTQSTKTAKIFWVTLDGAMKGGVLTSWLQFIITNIVYRLLHLMLCVVLLAQWFLIRPIN